MSANIENLLAGMGPLAVAVSGGVDSMTLATLAHRSLGRAGMLAVHAASPAVPGEATARVRDEAGRQGWRLRVIEAGEFADPRYRANPVNRCFFCKTNLYGAIRAVTDLQIVSGANLDDLGEYRPGLDAAREHGVRHPFVAAGLGKAAVRVLARELGLGDVAEGSEARVRCRVRAEGVVVELDARGLALLDTDLRADLGAAIRERAPAPALAGPVRFEPYRNGSAFLRNGVAR